MKEGEKNELWSSSSSSPFDPSMDSVGVALDLSIDGEPASERVVIELRIGDNWSFKYASYMVKEGKDDPDVSPAKVFHYGDCIGNQDRYAADDFGQQCGYQIKAYISPQFTGWVGFNIVFDHMDFLNCRVPVYGSVLQGNETLYKIQPHQRVVITYFAVIPKHELKDFLTKPPKVFPFCQIWQSLQHGDQIWEKFYSESEKLVLAAKKSNSHSDKDTYNSGHSFVGLKKKNYSESDTWCSWAIGIDLSNQKLSNQKTVIWYPREGLKKNKYPVYSQSDQGLKKNRYPYFSESDKGEKKSNVKRRKYRFCSDSGEGKKNAKD